MLSTSRSVLLTGATGLLGRYLLRELLRTATPVVVLVRNSTACSAVERIRSIVRYWTVELGNSLPEPKVLACDLALPDLGLRAADRRWLSKTCYSVIHAAASLEFRKNEHDEPFRTNVHGTRNLLGFCQNSGITEFHHVSTAFVCGADPKHPVYENLVDSRPTFHNPYEQSKWEAERLLHNAPQVQATIYRPSIIVGDSITGYTSTYHGIYRFAEMALRLAQTSHEKRRLDIRLPMTGAEPRNLVPVDWVAEAIRRIVQRPGLHGRIYHLVSRWPIPVSRIKKAAVAALGLDGIGWGGNEVIEHPSPLERHFLELLQQYFPYLQGDPLFDASNLERALPDFWPPQMDDQVLTRLFDYANRQRWGKADAVAAAAAAKRPSVCRTYVEEKFPDIARRSPLGRAIKLDVRLGIDIRGSDGGQWTLRWKAGELVSVESGLNPEASILYRMNTATFLSITGGRETPAQAFFDQRLNLEGDIEKGLNLAVWFEQLLQSEIGSSKEKGSLHESHR